MTNGIVPGKNKKKYNKVNEEGYQQDNLVDGVMVAVLFLFLL